MKIENIISRITKISLAQAIRSMRFYFIATLSTFEQFFQK